LAGEVNEERKMDESDLYHQPGVLRVLQSKKQTKAFYDRIAGIYDLLSERSEEAVRRAGLEMLDAQPGQKILEIGFGTGHCLVELARRVGPAGSVFGLDLSEKMRSISEQRLRQERLDDRVELSCGDALHLPYPAQTMDGVFMSFTLELFDTPEIPAVLGQCLHVLKGGGSLVVVAMSRVRGHGAVMEAFEWMHRHFPNYVDCRPILARRALEDAGFQIRETRGMKMWVDVEIVRGTKDSEDTG
jgi:ubiquinone/menaquinone biosynthesis C-methylase UbiE